MAPDTHGPGQQDRIQGSAADRDDAAWSAFCDEAEQLLDRVERTTKRMNGWLALCFLLAVIGWGVLLWALTR